MSDNIGFESVFSFLDYRAFLRQAFDARKSKSAKFSYRYLAGKTGLNAGFLLRVMKGERNLSLNHAMKIAEAFGLGKKESEYLELLILFNQADVPKEKLMYHKKLLAFPKTKIKTVEPAQFDFYDKWYYTAIREVLNFHPFRGDFEKLAGMLEPAIKPAEAGNAVDVLAKLGFLRKGPSGSYALDSQFIGSGPAVPATVIHKYQLATMELAMGALGRFSREERDVSTVSLSLSAKGLEAVKERTREFRKGLMEIADGDTAADRAFQLNIQLFPVSRKAKGKRE
jgi:uncharacterized protein (TIGR02147 family)